MREWALFPDCAPFVASGGTTVQHEIWSGGTEIVQSGGSAHSVWLLITTTSATIVTGGHAHGNA